MKFYRDSKTGDIYIRNGGKFQKFYDNNQDPGEDPNQPQSPNEPGNSPGDKPGNKPGDQSGNQPGDKPGNQPGEPQEPGKPGGPGDKPGNQPGKPGDQPGDQPGDKPGDQPGEPGNEPGDQLGGSGQGRGGQGISNGPETPGNPPTTDKYNPNNKIKELRKLLDDEKFMQDVADGLEPEIVKSKLNKDKGQFTDLSELPKVNQKINNVNELKSSIKAKLLAQAYKQEEESQRTWSQLDPRKLAGGAVVQGKRTIDKFKKTVPVLNVYQDVSGSWDSSDRQLGDSVVAELKDLNDKGIIQVRHKYFGVRVANSIADAGSRATNGIPVYDDIISEKPLNVMIITDRDVKEYEFSSENKSPLKVKGNVWFVWKQGQKSTGFLKYIGGKHVYEFDMN